MHYKVDTIALKKLMVENGIETISELAARTEVGRDTISGVLKGNIRPSTNVMERFIIALNIKPSDAGSIFFVPDLRNT